MRHAILAGLFTLVIAGCGGGGTATETTSPGPAGETATETSATAAGCTASGLDAMSSLADFQLETDDWTTYCAAIDDMRTELGL